MYEWRLEKGKKKMGRNDSPLENDCKQRFFENKKALESFSIEYRDTKITLANHNRRKQWELVLNTCSGRQARENACE